MWGVITIDLLCMFTIHLLVYEFPRFINDNWADILSSSGVFVAILLYLKGRKDEKSAAATMICSQIKLIEERLNNIQESVGQRDLEGTNAIYLVKEIVSLSSNSWEEYKHLFIKQLSAEEYKEVQDFFDYAKQVERARRDIVETMKNAWRDKSTVLHQEYANFIKLNPNPKICVMNNPFYLEWKVFENDFRCAHLDFTPYIVCTLLNGNQGDNTNTIELSKQAYYEIEKATDSRKKNISLKPLMLILGKYILTKFYF